MQKSGLTYMNHAGINGRKETTNINSNLFRFMELKRVMGEWT